MSAVGMMQGWQKVTKVRLSVSELSTFIRDGDMVEKHLLDQGKYRCLEQQWPLVRMAGYAASWSEIILL